MESSLSAQRLRPGGPTERYFKKLNGIREHPSPQTCRRGGALTRLEPLLNIAAARFPSRLRWTRFTLLVLPQLEPSKLVGQLQRLLQAPGVLPGSLSRHVLPAASAVQQGAQLLDPLAGLQAATGHFLREEGRGGLGGATVAAQEVEGKGAFTCGTWHRQVTLPASGSTVKSMAAV